LRVGRGGRSGCSAGEMHPDMAKGAGRLLRGVVLFFLVEIVEAKKDGSGGKANHFSSGRVLEIKKGFQGSICRP